MSASMPLSVVALGGLLEWDRLALFLLLTALLTRVLQPSRKDSSAGLSWALAFAGQALAFGAADWWLLVVAAVLVGSRG